MSEPFPLAGADVVCIASIDWDFVWQGHQEIMATFARGGCRVLFVENTGVRAARLRDLPRLRQRLRNWRRGTSGFREELPNLFVYSPVLLPLPYSRLAGALNRALLLRTLRRWTSVMGWGRPVIWTYLPTPLARAVIAGLDPIATVYYCIDDLASSSPGARAIASSEAALFREADLVFVTSEALRARAARHRPSVDVFPSGVDYPKFEAARLQGVALPPELAGLPRPIVGYVGGVHQWVDQELVVRVADGLPQASVVLLGPLQCDVEALRSRANVHLLGTRDHHDVPQCLRAFDVALVPYRLSEYTANVYPTKLNEYLAMGLPVVSTPLPEILRFVAEHGPLVDVGEGDDFVESVRRLAAHRGDEAARMAVARGNDWSKRVLGMATRVAEIRKQRLAHGDGWQARLRRAARRAWWRVLSAAAAVAGLLALVARLKGWI